MADTMTLKTRTQKINELLLQPFAPLATYHCLLKSVWPFNLHSFSILMQRCQHGKMIISAISQCTWCMKYWTYYLSQACKLYSPHYAYYMCVIAFKFVFYKIGFVRTVIRDLNWCTVLHTYLRVSCCVQSVF